MNNVSKELKFVSILLLITGILLIGLTVDNILYYSSQINENELEDSLYKETFYYTVDLVYFGLYSITGLLSLFFAFVFSYFIIKRKSWSWTGSIILLSFTTIYYLGRLAPNITRTILDDSFNMIFAIILEIILVVIGIYLLYLLTRKKIKDHFYR